jgi:hypothetical protein
MERAGPDGKGKLIAHEIVSALVPHFHQIDLSNAHSLLVRVRGR